MKVDHTCHVRRCVNPKHLRLATHKQNLENHNGANCNSKSGVRGVHWEPKRKKWIAQVRHNGSKLYLGGFTDMSDAESAVVAKRQELHTYNLKDREAN